MPSKAQNYVIPAGAFNGIASGAKNANCELNRGPLYKKLQIFTTNTAGTLTDPTTIIDRFRLKMGSVTLRDMTPAQAINYLKMYGVTPVTGEIPIPFARDWLQDKRLAERNAWDTYGQPGKFTLEADFLTPGGGVGVQSVDQTIAAGRNVRRNPKTGKAEPFLAIHKMKSEVAAATGAQTVTISTLDHSLPIKALLFTVSANAISDLEIIADSVQVFKNSRTRENARLAHYKLDGTQFDFAYVPDADGSRHSLRCSSLDVKVTVTGACTITVLNVQEAPAYV